MSNRRFAHRIVWALIVVVGVIYIQGCGTSSSSTTEDSSVSGSVASVLGGTYNTSQSGGTLALLERIRRTPLSIFLDAFDPSIKDAKAATVCPTYATASGTGAGSCSVSGGVMTLDYGSTGCSFTGSAATWEGSQTLTLSTGSPSCGTFPAGSSYSGTLTRLFPPTTTRTSVGGVVVTVDTSGTDSGYAFSGSAPSGGIVVTFSGGSRTDIALSGVNLIAQSAIGVPRFNHSITTSGTGGSAITLGSGTVTGGTVLVYHNLMKVLGTTTFKNLTFGSGCCLPTGGTITTSFSAVSGTNPTVLGSLFVGKSETLTITGCGTGTYTGPESYTGNVTLPHCF
jgi:hypothetical protein